MSGFEYDISDLEEIQATVTRVKPVEIYQRAAPEIERLITEQFWAGTDPFGNPWATLVRTGEQSHLIDTGALLSSVHITGQSDGLGFEMDYYGGYHQTGTSRMVARPILPLAGDYPDSWDNTIANEMLALLPTAERG
jgi:hypothetical protein